jgi:prophage DNA circulation protein
MEYIPKINDYYLDIKDIRDSREYAIARHEYPFSQKNKLENTGLKTKSIHVECVFQDEPTLTDGWSTDEGFYPTFESHYNFLADIDNNLDNIKFIHPTMGEMEGKIENIGTFYNDSINFVEVSFDFLQEITDDTPSYVQYVIPENAKKFRETSSRMKEILEEAEKLATNAQAWQNDMNTYRATLQAKLSSITSPAQSIANTITYGASLPGLVLHDINMSIDRIVESFTDIINSPSMMVNSLIVELRAFKNTFTGLEKQYVHIMGASRLAYESAVQLEADEDSRTELRNKEETSSFDANGNYMGNIVMPDVMTANDLDKIIAEIKLFIDEAIQLDRHNPELLIQARSLQDYVNKIKLERERIVTKTYSDQPLHAILLSEGLNYQMAERVLALNPDIKNPMFAMGDVDLIVPVEK